MSEDAEFKPTVKHILIGAYVLIAVCVAVYKTYFTHSIDGFAYNLGAGMMWPFLLFPALGKILGVIIIVGIIAAVTILG